MATFYKTPGLLYFRYAIRMLLGLLFGLVFGAGILVFSAAICCTILGIRVLLQDNTANSGVATLRFNFTGILPSGSPVRLRAIPSLVGLPKSVGATFSSVLAAATSNVKSAAGAATSNLKSAASAVETSVVGTVSTLNAALPKNCSLGTENFCFGFDTHTTCDNLPFNTSVILQGPSSELIQAAIEPLQPLEKVLAKITPAYVKGTAIAGLVLLSVMAGLFAYFALKLSSLPRLRFRLAICFLCLLLWIPFLIPIGIISVVRSKIQGFGPLVEMDIGDISMQSIENLFCAIIISLGIIALILLGPLVNLETPVVTQ